MTLYLSFCVKRHSAQQVTVTEINTMKPGKTTYFNGDKTLDFNSLRAG